MDVDPGVPDPIGDEPRPGGPGPAGGEWEFEDEGPFFAWLPPEDRLWRHPSERVGGRTDGPAGPASRPAWRAFVGLPTTVVRSTWAVALIAGLIGATAATTVGLATGFWPHDTTVVRSVVPSTSSVSLADVGPEPTNWTAVDDAVAPSVVTVSVQGAAGPQVFSGVVLSESVGGVTYIVSDRSPFARDRAAGYVGAVNVSFLAGQTARAQLVGEDALSGLAVIQVSDAVTAIPVNVGTVADLHEADQVLSVGSRAVPSVATGVSTGSVSGEDRTVTLVDGTDLDGLIAIAAPSLGAGAAGGPVLNQFGEVVALTLSLDPATSSDQAFTFAVPIDQVTRIATEIIDRAPLTHPWLGVSDAGDLPSATAHQMGVPGGVQAGAVAPGSPAGQAGLRPADVITTFDGKPVSSTGALVSDISVCVPGKVVPMTYVHDGRTVQAAVRIGEEPADE